MKNIKFVLIVKSVFMFAGLMMAFSTLLPSVARGDIWPSFRHDTKNTGRSPYNAPISDPVEKWTFNHGGDSDPSTVIGADGTIYQNSYSGTLYALNPDGTEKWNFSSGSDDYSTPAIGADGTIYFGSYDDYKLYAVNPTDGSKKWDFEVDGDSIAASPAIGADGTIYFGSYDDKLYALNPDGSKKWDFETGDDIYEYQAPAIGDDGTIYFGSNDDIFYALNPDGTILWKFISAGDDVCTSPAIGDDGTIYFGSNDDKLYALNPDGSKKWDFETGDDIRSSPAIGCDGTIYFGSEDDKFYALNPDGSKKWDFETGGSIYSSPVIGADGTIYFGSEDDNLYALDPDGTKLWEFATGGSIYASPAIGADGTLYIGSYDDKLYAITGTTATAGYASTPVAPGGTIGFGSSAVGVAATDQTFDVQETGGANLTVNKAAVAITGDHASDFSIVSPVFPFTIANCGGADQTVTVACTPSAEGVRTATLNLTSNDPANAAVTYTLMCTGTTGTAPPVPEVNVNDVTWVISGPHSVGSVIKITVPFSYLIWVKGIPSLALNTGGPVPGHAYYTGGSGTKIITFEYTVASGDDITVLDYWSPWALELNGGRIYSNQGVDAVLVLSVSGESGSPGYNNTTGVLSAVYPVYRFYSPGLSKHFFTTDENEKEYLLANAADVWQLENSPYSVFLPWQYNAAADELKAALIAVHRFYNAALLTHLYTADANEAAHLIAEASDVWQSEGPVFYVPVGNPEGAIPVYRFYSENLKVHLFTADENEKTHLVETAGDVWRFEGIAYYAFP